MLGGRGRPDSFSWQTIGVVVLSVLAALLVALAFTNEPKVGVAASGHQPSGPRSAPTVPVSTGSSSAPSSPTTSSTAPVPDVSDKRRVDFASSSGLPDGSRIYDNPAVGSAMAVHDGVLTNGQPQGVNATSTLETQLGAKVQKVGARIRFSGTNSGYAVLVAWQSSFVDARRAGRDAPPSGLRLVVTPTDWSLTTSPDNAVLANGHYTLTGDNATFQVVRQDDTAWVVQPNGQVTTVTDARIAGRAGPWAAWQLVEATPQQSPAGFESVWAG